MALLAVVLWSGNFIVAKATHQQIPPISLAFFRWLTATLLLLPFSYKAVFGSIKSFRKYSWYFFFTSLFGITLFNTLVYVSAHFSMAVNIALIGTTSSPIVATVLAAVFLKEKITMARIVGMLVCLAGVLLLISKASWNTLLHFQFSKGDAWVIGGAFCFAIYNTLVRKKPSEIPSKAFLWMVFALGTVLLIPFYLAETLGMLTITHTTTIGWNWPLVGSIFYLGLGASVISFLCWNLAIARLGAGRTALFGNLIPVFSSLEAVLFLSEKITVLHYFTGLIIIAGLFIANFSLLFKKKQSE